MSHSIRSGICVADFSGNKVAYVPLTAQKAAEEKRTKGRLSRIEARSQAATMQTEIEIRSRLAAQVASGSITSEDASRLLQQEVALRPLVVAAASAEGQERADLTAAVADLTEAYEGLADAQKQADSAAFVKGRTDRIADLQLEQRLLGETTADQLRARAVAEANRLIADRGLSGPDADAARYAAADAAEAQVRINRERAARDLANRAVTDGLSAAASAANNPITRANLEAQREYADLIAQSADADHAAAVAAQARTRAVLDLQTSTQAQVTQTGEELALRPLIAAAAALEGDEKRRLLGVIGALRTASAAMADIERQASGRAARGGWTNTFRFAEREIFFSRR